MMEKDGYRIPEWNMPELESKLDKLNRKAKKLGCPEIKLNVTREFTEKTEEGYLKKYIVVNVTGGAPIIAGWRFIGTVEWTEAGNILQLMEGYSAPEKYKTCEPICEHCHTKRSRKNVYLVVNGNEEYKMVGGSCLKDFTGHNNPEAVASMLQYLRGSWLDEYEDEDVFGGYGKMDPQIALDRYLAYTAATIRSFGWKSRTTAKEDFSRSTADRAYDSMFPSNYLTWREKEELATPEDQDVNIAKAAIEWARNLETTNDYQHNIKIIATLGYTTDKNIGFAASIVSSYQKSLIKEEERKARADKKPSEHIGNIKDKVKLDLTFIGETSFETYFGIKYLYRFADSEGNVIVWRTATGFSEELKPGETYTIKGAIKDHTEWKNIKQTELTRCKIV
jgi:hypothetical protein